MDESFSAALDKHNVDTIDVRECASQRPHAIREIQIISLAR